MESTNKTKNNKELTPIDFEIGPEELDAIVKERLKGHQKGHTANLLDRERELVNATIMDMMRKGLSTTLIVKEIRQRWGISQPTAYKWINLAYKDAGDTVKAVKTDMVLNLVEMAQRTYNDAVARNDGKTQTAALELLTKLTGAQAPVKQEIKIQTDFEFGN